jgi:ubiquinone/menaquinone biosynthesis C-methylase UbiE
VLAEAARVLTPGGVLVFPAADARMPGAADDG